VDECVDVARVGEQQAVKRRPAAHPQAEHDGVSDEGYKYGRIGNNESDCPGGVRTLQPEMPAGTARPAGRYGGLERQNLRAAHRAPQSIGPKSIPSSLIPSRRPWSGRPPYS